MISISGLMWEGLKVPPWSYIVSPRGAGTCVVLTKWLCLLLDSWTWRVLSPLLFKWFSFLNLAQVTPRSLCCLIENTASRCAPFPAWSQQAGNGANLILSKSHAVRSDSEKSQIFYFKTIIWSHEYSSVKECLPGMCKTLESSYSTENKKG